MGSNADGKLGLSCSYQDMTNATCPRLIETMANIIQIAAGESHSLAVDKDYRVYGWGQADNGAIGMRLSNASFPIPITIGESHERVKEVSCGLKHSCFLTRKDSKLCNPIYS
jgi:alpha-tubulin suppressor-like RCC1 family protein